MESAANCRYQELFNSLFKLTGTYVPVDLSSTNPASHHLDIQDRTSMQRFVDDQIRAGAGTFGYGGYLERRAWYVRNAHFTEPGRERCIHIGIDVWVPVSTPIHAPLSGTVHSFRDNDATGDYGPTLILRHHIKGREVHSLYGHLSRTSLANYQVGKHYEAGEELGFVGPFEENGEWPPHLHFQLIYDMERYSGDYRGVASDAELDHYVKNCPDPATIIEGRSQPVPDPLP